MIVLCNWKREIAGVTSIQEIVACYGKPLRFILTYLEILFWMKNWYIRIVIKQIRRSQAQQVKESSRKRSHCRRTGNRSGRRGLNRDLLWTIKGPSVKMSFRGWKGKAHDHAPQWHILGDIGTCQAVACEKVMVMIQTLKIFIKFSL